MISEKIASYEALAKELKNHGDLATITMLTLRQIHKADRLGVNVIANIQETLTAMGLGYLPKSLPNNQYAVALLYRKGSTISKVIDHIMDIKEDSDEKLQKLVGSDDAQQVIKKIKELVCD